MIKNEKFHDKENRSRMFKWKPKEVEKSFNMSRERT